RQQQPPLRGAGIEEVVAERNRFGRDAGCAWLRRSCHGGRPVRAGSPIPRRAVGPRAPTLTRAPPGRGRAAPSHPRRQPATVLAVGSDAAAALAAVAASAGAVRRIAAARGAGASASGASVFLAAIAAA